MIAFLGISFVFCTCFLYNGYKNTIVNRKRLIDEPVNQNEKTDKMKTNEIFVYILMFVVAILFVIQIAYKGAKFPSATAVLIRTVILVPIMALFNARKRTGKALIVLFASLLFLLFCTITYMAIGLPVKAPILAINDTEVRLGQTTVRELMDDGFDIYIEKGNTTGLDYEESLVSEQFEKYSDITNISIPKGYHRQTLQIVPYSKGILVKGNTIIAEVIFYGSMTNETPLKDCSIIYFSMREEHIPKVKDNGISLKLNGVNLLSKIEMTVMEKNFGHKIYRPNQIEEDKRFIISWESNSHHLFYNSYAAIIYMDDNYLANSIELECQIARESD